MRLIQAAFACDLTRVVTFNMEAIPDDHVDVRAAQDLGATDVHDLIHKVDSSDPLSKNATAVGVIKQFHTEYAKQFAKLLDYLAAIPEADGTTALHHTVVLWCGEIATGNHDLHICRGSSPAKPAATSAPAAICRCRARPRRADTTTCSWPWRTPWAARSRPSARPASAKAPCPV